MFFIFFSVFFVKLEFGFNIRDYVLVSKLGKFLK